MCHKSDLMLAPFIYISFFLTGVHEQLGEQLQVTQHRVQWRTHLLLSFFNWAKLLNHNLCFRSVNMPHCFSNQSSNKAGNRRKSKTGQETSFLLKGQITTMKIFEHPVQYAWVHLEKVLFPHNNWDHTVCRWSLCSIKSLSTCSHEEVASQAFLECPEMKESWHRVKASKKQQRSHHPLSTLISPLQRTSCSSL